MFQIYFLENWIRNLLRKFKYVIGSNKRKLIVAGWTELACLITQAKILNLPNCTVFFLSGQWKSDKEQRTMGVKSNRTTDYI